MHTYHVFGPHVGLRVPVQKATTLIHKSTRNLYTRASDCEVGKTQINYTGNYLNIVMHKVVKAFLQAVEDYVKRAHTELDQFSKEADILHSVS